MKIRTRRTRKVLSLERLESRRLLTNYYVDAINGDDSNPGTTDAPLESYLPFVAAYGQDDPNIGRIDLEAGDVVEFAPGVYDQVFRLPESTSKYYGMYLRGAKGTAEQPIVLRGRPGAVLAATAPNGSEVIKATLFDTAYVDFQGFEITGHGWGTWVVDSENVRITDNWIHDNHGSANKNICGISLKSSANIIVAGNLIHDNFELDKTHINSRNVQFNENDGLIDFHNNVVFHTADPADGVGGTGASVKHLNTGQLHIHHNVLSNQWLGAVTVGTALANVDHNLILNSDGVFSIAEPGLEWYDNVDIRNNTLVDLEDADFIGGGLWMTFPPAIEGRPLGTFRFKENIVLDRRSYNIDRGIHRIGTYQEDELYDIWIEQGRFQADENVYFNPNHNPQFNLFNPNGGDRNGSLGGEYTFPQWQSLGFDLNGEVIDPEFDDVYLPQNATASAAGWYADEAARLTVLTGDDEILEGQTTQAVVIRSGDELDLTQALTVNLATTDATEIEFPQTVTFQPGEAKAYFSIGGVFDGEPDQTRPTRIDAFADGFTNNVSAWIRVESNEGEAIPEIKVVESDSHTQVSEAGSTDTIEVSLNSQPESDVFIIVISDDEGEVTASVRELLFDATNWNAPQSVVLTGVDDGLIDGDRVSAIHLTVDADRSDADWSNAADKNVTVVTADDETPVDGVGYSNGIWTLPGTPDQVITVDFAWTERLGEYDNELGIFLIDDITGSLNGVAPTSSEYPQQALSSDSRQIVFASGAGAGAASEMTMRGGDLIAFYMIQNASTERFLSENPRNDVTNRPLVFFSIDEANPDSIAHVRTTRLTDDHLRFGWEDILGGGDESFRDAVVDVSLAEPDQGSSIFVEYAFGVTDQDGNPQNSLRVGDEFFLEVVVEDLRDEAMGVFSAYLDIEFEPEIASINGPIDFVEPFSGAKNAAVLSGSIDEAGAISNDDNIGSAPTVIFRVPMLATNEGVLTVAGNPADVLPEHETSVFGIDASIDTSQIRYQRLALVVESAVLSLQNPRGAEDVNDDEHVSPLDALLIINFLHRHGAVDFQQSPALVANATNFLDVNDDKTISALDALRVINELSRTNQVMPLGEQVSIDRTRVADEGMDFLADRDILVSIAASSDDWEQRVDDVLQRFSLR